jgi:hypothetical protein
VFHGDIALVVQYLTSGARFQRVDPHDEAVEYGCGAHSEVEAEPSASTPVADLVYDDSLLDIEPR